MVFRVRDPSHQLSNYSGSIQRTDYEVVENVIFMKTQDTIFGKVLFS